MDNSLVALKAAKAIFEAQGITEKNRILGEQYKAVVDAILNLEKPEPEPEQAQSFEHLRETCKTYINFVYSENYHEDNDNGHYIFESALMAIYGVNIFDKINKKHK